MTMTWMMSLVNSYGFDFGSGKPARRLGVYFHGVNGTLYANYGMHRVVPEGDRMKDFKTPAPSIPSSPGHEREWLDCVRSRKQPSCSAFYHYRIDVAISLAMLAHQLRRTIHFDPAAERIVGDREAVEAAKPTYLAPWRFPDEYLRGSEDPRHPQAVGEG
jgi:hypothetical protein